MSQSDTVMTTKPVSSVEEIQKGWHDLELRVRQMEASGTALEQENKELRTLLERVIEHRQKSHGELINLLSGLVSKLPINDIGVVVSQLVEHNSHVAEVCAALAKGKVEATMIQPAILRVLDETKRNLTAALKSAVEEFIKLDPPLETALLQSFVKDPELAFKPMAVRASRCYVKGQLPRERIVREFGEEALVFFTDVTTDPKLNPRPKPDDIMLCICSNLDEVIQQNPTVIPDQQQELRALYDRVKRSRASTKEAQAQKQLFLRVTFLLDLLHYYENQSTLSPDVVFAQRLSGVLEQLMVPPTESDLSEQLILGVEKLLDFIINHDHRLSAINNTGKGGGLAKTIRFILRLRSEKQPDDNPTVLNEVVPEFVKHLVTPAPRTPAQQQTVVAALKLLTPALQKLVVRAVMASDRLGKEEGEALSKLLAKELNLGSVEEVAKPSAAMPPEMERQLAWERVKDLIGSRADPGEIASAIRDRLHAKYDSDEIKQSWLTLIEADPMALIRTFCQLPYLATGKTDTIAQPVLEAYVVRLTHEKYASTYTKVINSLKNMYKVKADSPALVNFVSLAKWADADCGAKIAADIGMSAR